MRGIKMKTGCLALAVIAVVLSGCGSESGDSKVFDFLISENETYEKESNDPSAYSMEDKASLYEGDDLSVVTMYLTVGYGNADDETNHTWTEINEKPLSYYEEKDIAEPYKCEAVLQIGDDVGPVKGEFGYGERVANATVRLRGEGASEQEQKSYRIDIKKGKGKWNDQKAIVLNKHMGDPLRVTNKLAYSLMEGIPGMISVRTRLVHLYVKDRTEGANGLFEDYGLYTQVEQINKTYLKNHGFDKDGQLYKAENFRWERSKDSIMLATSKEFKLENFEQYLEIKGNEDHTKLLELLDAVNQEDTGIQSIVEKYFDRENLYYWLGFQILTGNKETSSGNYYIYSPQVLDKWYFISGNNSDAFSDIYKKQQDVSYSPSWNTGIFTYADSVLFSRIFHDKQCREELTAAIEDLYRNYLKKERVEKEADRLREVAEPYIYSLPDALQARVTSEDYAIIMDNLAAEVDNNYQLYLKSLKKPWPFHILEPEQEDGKLMIRWEKSDLCQDSEKEEVTYRVELADHYEFDTCIFEESNVKGTSVETNSLPAGQYFLRIQAETASGEIQDAYEYYYTEQGTTIYGVQCFYVMEDGSIECLRYQEEE